MIRNLKALMLAAMALAVFGALAASPAQAAKFHSGLAETTVIVKTDGTSKTAHQVFDAPGGATATCSGVSGHGSVVGEEVETIDVTLNFEQACTFLGQPATVSTNKCIFGFKSNGKVELKGVGCELSVSIPGCVVTFETPNTYEGISYHNINTEGGATETTPTTYTTISAAVTGIKGTATGGTCPVPGAFTTGEFTTGNAIVEGQAKGGGAMTKVWWA